MKIKELNDYVLLGLSMWTVKSLSLLNFPGIIAIRKTEQFIPMLV